MRIPNGDRAVVPIEKLAGYCLNPDHPVGKHKAKVFERVLGMTAVHAPLLAAALTAAARDSDGAVAGVQDRYGARYQLDVDVTGPRGAGIVRSAWIVASPAAAPVLITCYVL